MRRELPTTSVAFLTGLTLGGFAMGFTDAPINTPNTQESQSPFPAAAKSDRRAGAGETQLATEAAISTALQAEPGDDALVIELGPMSDSEHRQVMIARWANLEGQVNRLLKRIDGLERRLAATGSATDDDGGSEDREVEILPTDTPDNQRVALISAGVPPSVADELVWRRSQQEIDRLELRDQAIREGWFRTERYAEELRRLNSDATGLRTEIGDAAYDRYLYQTGEFNRVRVDSIIEGSVADQTGLLPGDVIESYDGELILNFSDLRNATTNGARDEEVPVVVRRGDSVIETWLARGPIGIRLEGAAVAPDD